MPKEDWPRIHNPDDYIVDKIAHNRLNCIRKKFLSALYLLLSEQPDNSTILIAWIIFVVYGLLNEENLKLLKNHSDVLDKLPWHSDKMEDIKTWIPEAFLCFTTQAKKRQFSIFKLKSYLNHFYFAVLRSDNFEVTIDPSSPSGVVLTSRYDNQDITELFCTYHFPTIVVYLEEELCSRLYDVSDHKLVTFQLGRRENFVFIGASSLVFDPRSERKV